MMQCEVTLTANAGVMLAVGGKHILIDALHDEKIQGFSTLSADTLSAVWTKFEVRGPDVVTATHLHPDHASKSLWNEARLRWPGSTFISPTVRLDGSVTLEMPKENVTLEDIKIDAMLLPHEGEEYASVVNYGYFMEVKGFTILVLGDCAVSATDKILELIGPRQVDLAILNFPWVTLTRPRAFVQNVLAPKHLVLVHLPFPQDDRGGYLDATRKAMKSLLPMDAHTLSEPMEKIKIS